jgi:3-hydroxyisobutyrate dehydrogenase-like beta-hydroxyacid dehydrogenase
MTVVGVMHPGAMGSAVGAVLAAAGHDVLWASQGRSDATAQRARGAGLTDVGAVGVLLDRAEVVLCICPPHAARNVAERAAGFDGLYVDANAVSPQTARAVAALLAPGRTRFVDGGIIGPPPAQPATTRLYLSGDDASAVAGLFAGGPLDAVVVPGGVGAASALKLTYAAWTKGTAALLLSIRAVARAHGVEDALLSEWALSQPDLPGRSAGAARAAAEKGWRWEGEMREVAATFAEAGLPDGFHLAAADVFAAPTPLAPRSSS